MKSNGNNHPNQHKPRVLLVSHGDGYLEVFSDYPLSVYHATMPAVSPSGELKAEHAMEASLPKPFQRIFEPGYRRFATNVRTVTVEEAIQHQVDLAMWRALDALSIDTTHVGEVVLCTL